MFAVSVGVSSSLAFHHATLSSTSGREHLVTAKSQRYMMLKGFKLDSGRVSKAGSRFPVNCVSQ